jgi:hypothetical protein
MLLTVLLVLSFASISQGEPTYRSLTDMNFEWYLKNTERIGQILVSGTDEDAVPIINTLCLIWKHRDGSIWIEVSPALGKALIYKTRLVLLWFSQYPEEYSSWLNKMPTALFTAWSGENADVVRLEKLRVKMIENLKTYQKSETDKDLRQKCLALIEVLQKTKVGKIE